MPRGSALRMEQHAVSLLRPPDRVRATGAARRVRDEVLRQPERPRGGRRGREQPGPPVCRLPAPRRAAKDDPYAEQGASRKRVHAAIMTTVAADGASWRCRGTDSAPCRPRRNTAETETRRDRA